MAALNSLFSRLKRQPAAARLRDQGEIKRLYRSWRIRILYATTGGYAVYYFVRNNLPVAAPSIIRQYHLTNTQWGNLITVTQLVYGVSKFSGGVLADVINPRFLLPVGLILSAAANICFGFGTGMGVFLSFWILNSVFSGVGVPPCARLLTHWFSPREIGRAWGIWNSSHQIGSAIIAVLAGYLITHFGWRSAFFVPAVIAVGVSFWLFNRLTDSPETLGLPPIEEHQAFESTEGGATREALSSADGSKGPGPLAAPSELRGEERAEDSPLHLPDPEPYWTMFRRNILTNKGVWIVSIANFFVYVVRIGIVQWSFIYLTNAKHLTLISASFCILCFEIAGMFGAYSSGWLSDRVFKGRCGPVSAGYMLILIGLVLVLFRVSNGDTLILGAVFSGLGFFVYGPQMLVAVAATDFSTKIASASAVGLTGLLGYLGAAFCGLSTGRLVDHFGWNAAIWLYAGSAAVGCLLLATTWGMEKAKK